MTETEKAAARKRLKNYLLLQYEKKLDKLLPFVEEGDIELRQATFRCEKKTGEWIEI